MIQYSTALVQCGFGLGCRQKLQKQHEVGWMPVIAVLHMTDEDVLSNNKAGNATEGDDKLM